MPTNANTTSQAVLETSRLTLRSFFETDAQTVHQLINDKQIAANTRTIEYPYPAGQAITWIRRQQEQRKNGESFVFAICLKKTQPQTLIGAIGLEINQEDHNAELGYWLGRDFWNAGYCSEAAREVIEFGFEQVGLQKIFAQHMTRNPASGRVLEKIGMTREGLLRSHCRKWGVFVDVVTYGILHDDPRPEQEQRN